MGYIFKYPVLIKRGPSICPPEIKQALSVLIKEELILQPSFPFFPDMFSDMEFTSCKRGQCRPGRAPGQGRLKTLQNGPLIRLRVGGILRGLGWESCFPSGFFLPGQGMEALAARTSKGKQPHGGYVHSQQDPCPLPVCSRLNAHIQAQGKKHYPLPVPAM